MILTLVCQGQKILEYRPRVNYGQVLRDFSNNGLHAVSGSTSAAEINDVIPTDRGCYFNGSKSQKITLPANDVSTSPFNLPSTFMIATWIMIVGDQGGLVFLRFKDTSNYFYLRRISSYDSAAVQLVLNGIIVHEGPYAFPYFYKGN